MIRLEPELGSVSIVFVGSFNPQIFQPAWLGAEELIRPEEAEVADIKIVHPEIVAFAIDWFELEVDHNRFILRTTQKTESPAQIRDLAAGIFSVLAHTPLHLMGLNCDGHYRFDSDQRLADSLDALAPATKWEDILAKPAVKSQEMQGERPDDYKGYIRVTVEPSVRVDAAVYIRVNDHYEFAESPTARGAEKVLQALKSAWTPSLERGDAIASHLLSLK